MILDTLTIKQFFTNANGRDIVCLMSEMDKMQDATDQSTGKHTPIPLTVAIMAELIHRSRVKAQQKAQE